MVLYRGGTLSCPERLGEKQNIQSWRNDCFYEGDSAMTSSPVSMACTWGRGRHPLPAPNLSHTLPLQFNARGDSWARPSTAHFDVVPAFFLLSLSVSPSDKSSTRVPPPIQVGNYLRTAELPSRRAGTPRELRDAASSAALLLLKAFFQAAPDSPIRFSHLFTSYSQLFLQPLEVTPPRCELRRTPDWKSLISSCSSQSPSSPPHQSARPLFHAKSRGSFNSSEADDVDCQFLRRCFIFGAVFGIVKHIGRIHKHVAKHAGTLFPD